MFNTAIGALFLTIKVENIDTCISATVANEDGLLVLLDELLALVRWETGDTLTVITNNKVCRMPLLTPGWFEMQFDRCFSKCHLPHGFRLSVNGSALND
ncbi:hypothetical protein SAMN04515618_12058 [Collimonas sp. OK307]|nr:hypothetical protein SAMN04515618_12058 [Collimonas sp. OK307]